MLQNLTSILPAPGAHAQPSADGAPVPADAAAGFAAAMALAGLIFPPLVARPTAATGVSVGMVDSATGLPVAVVDAPRPRPAGTTPTTAIASPLGGGPPGVPAAVAMGAQVPADEHRQGTEAPAPSDAPAELPVTFRASTPQPELAATRTGQGPSGSLAVAVAAPSRPGRDLRSGADTPPAMPSSPIAPSSAPSPAPEAVSGYRLVPEIASTPTPGLEAAPAVRAAPEALATPASAPASSPAPEPAPEIPPLSAPEAATERERPRPAAPGSAPTLGSKPEPGTTLAAVLATAPVPAVVPEPAPAAVTGAMPAAAPTATAARSRSLAAIGAARGAELQEPLADAATTPAAGRQVAVETNLAALAGDPGEGGRDERPGSPAGPQPSVASAVAEAPAFLAATAAAAPVPQPEAGPAPAPATMVAAEVVRAVERGVDEVRVALEPAALGGVEVKLELGRDGELRASFVVERPETLQLLQRDARTLQETLTGAGLQLAESGLSFSLRDEGGRGEQPPARRHQTFGQPMPGGEPPSASRQARGLLDLSV